MKRTTLAIALIFALSFSVMTATSFIKFGKANWLLPTNQKPPDAPLLIVYSPVNNETQTKSDVDLEFTIYVKGLDEYFDPDLSWIGYSLDEKPNVTFRGDFGTPKSITNLRTITDLRVLMFASDVPVTEIHLSGKLTGLTDGTHSLIVSAQYVGEYSPAPYKIENFSVIGHSEKICFSIDTHPPEVSILSPKPITYSVADVSLNVTFSESVSWVRYSLDGKANVTLNANNALSLDHSLTALSDGKHNLTLYVSDQFNHIQTSENIEFLVFQENEVMSDPTPSSASILLVVSQVLVAVFVGASLLVYFKRHHVKSRDKVREIG